MSKVIYCKDCGNGYCKNQDHIQPESIVCNCGCNKHYTEEEFYNHCYEDSDFDKWLDVAITNDSEDVVRIADSVDEFDKYNNYDSLSENNKKKYDFVHSVTGETTEQKINRVKDHLKSTKNYIIV